MIKIEFVNKKTGEVRTFKEECKNSSRAVRKWTAEKLTNIANKLDKKEEK